ncbi:hypothetical protein B0A55_12773 [Friedmanniomyces simplex]|uniref:BTB domain-containing protein n=1 Tax=Friedmanniomyces simplex TaxID=329884 RepID=A0A4U0VS17_9PEZI|nr:hypothetical protein B0A55_12773 [Friedmanniomyces simplex]
MSMMKRVNILPDGDLVLAVSGSLELRTSTVVLGNASPVFKAMLGPKFAEGQALQGDYVGIPHTVTLPDNDPEAMQSLCLILQCGAIAPSSSVPAELMVKTTLLADKYDCIDAIKRSAALWAANIDAEKLDLYTVAALSEAAFLLDDTSLFAKYTKEVVLNVTKSSVDELRQVEGCRLEIIDAVAEVAKDALEKIIFRIASFVSDTSCYLQDRINTQGYEEDHEDADEHCGYDEDHEEDADEHDGYDVQQEVEGAWLRALDWAQLWPEELQPDNLRQLLGNVRSFSVPVSMLSSTCSCDEATSARIIEHLRRETDALKRGIAKVPTAVYLGSLKDTDDSSQTDCGE